MSKCQIDQRHKNHKYNINMKRQSHEIVLHYFNKSIYMHNIDIHLYIW